MRDWQKSSFSGGQDGPDCVELAPAPGAVLIRESDEPARVLWVDRGGLAALIRAVRTEKA